MEKAFDSIRSLSPRFWLVKETVPLPEIAKYSAKVRDKSMDKYSTLYKSKKKSIELPLLLEIILKVLEKSRSFPNNHYVQVSSETL